MAVRLFYTNSDFARVAEVRVSGGDLCIRKYAEAPTEPAGENVDPYGFVRCRLHCVKSTLRVGGTPRLFDNIFPCPTETDGKLAFYLQKVKIHHSHLILI